MQFATVNTATRVQPKELPIKKWLSHVYGSRHVTWSKTMIWVCRQLKQVCNVISPIMHIIPMFLQI